MVSMVRLERLREDHAAALLAFERENREYFARSIPDRGNAYFVEFPSRHRTLLTEQDAGLHRFHVLIGQQGELIGRVNLVDITDGAAELGYRVAERAAGRGVATAAVEEVCRLAAVSYRLSALTAVTTRDNPASMAVLRRNGFEAMEDITLVGRPGIRYQRLLTAPH